MRKVICPNGHHYDADRFGSSCPFCGAAAQGAAANITSEQSTVPLNFETQAPTQPNVEATVPNNEEANKKIKPVIQETGDDTIPADIDIEEGIIAQIEPIVGWLVCTKGVNKGRDYRLHKGRNFIGRAPQMDVFIQGDITVSRSAHAVVVYDPRSNVYLAQPGDSKELLYINDALVLNPTELKKGDKLSVGETTLMFVPLCEEDFHW